MRRGTRCSVLVLSPLVACSADGVEDGHDEVGATETESGDGETTEASSGSDDTDDDIDDESSTDTGEGTSTEDDTSTETTDGPMPICGDANVDLGEECDDGDTIPGDGCSDTCEFETKYVFTTSTLHTGNLGGLEGADAICQARAMEAGLPGTYLAWLSTSQAVPQGEPVQRFTKWPGPYVLVDGTKVADDWDDLTDGSLHVPINSTETGDEAPYSITCMSKSVWTNTVYDGTMISGSSSCSDWTSASPDLGSEFGDAEATRQWWTTACGGDCHLHEALYCFEQ